MPDLYVCVDPGGSQTKIVYQLEDSTGHEYCLMSPEVEAVSKAELDLYFDSKGWDGNPVAAQQAWIEVQKKVVVVGAFASKFDPQDRLAELKYENALFKVLAAIGVIRERHNLTKKKLSLRLAILLPANEYNDRVRFREKLTEFLSAFRFRGEELRVKLECFICRPEGAGLISIATNSKGLEWYQSHRLGVLMLGHRNVSVIVSNYGSIETIESPQIGFSWFLDSIVNKTSGLDRKRLAEAIFQSLDEAQSSIYSYSYDRKISFERIHYTKHPCWKEFSGVQNLASAKDSELRQQEIEDIVLAVERATKEYWAKVSKWLDRTFDKKLDSVIVSGGAARFLEPELEKYFNCEPVHDCNSTSSDQDYNLHFQHYRTHKYQVRDSKYHFTPIMWGAGLQTEIEDIFEFKGSKESLGYRLIDSYGLFLQLINKQLKFHNKSNV
jgi:hypothetical protein